MRVLRTVSVAICGMSGSGKTALTARLRGKDFVENYVPTIGADLSAQHVLVEEDIGTSIYLQIQDFSGDKKYEASTKIFYPGRTAIYFVVDPTLDLDPQLKMFDGVLDQIEAADDMFLERPDPLLFLVQTKADLQTAQNKLEVAARLQEFIKQQAEKNRMFALHVTSAKTNNDPGIKELLESTLFNTKYLNQQNTVFTKIKNPDDKDLFFRDRASASRDLFKELFPENKSNLTQVKNRLTLDEKPEKSPVQQFRFR